MNKAQFQHDAKVLIENKEILTNTRRAVTTAFGHIVGFDPELDRLIAGVREQGQAYCNSYELILSHLSNRLEPKK